MKLDFVTDINRDYAGVMNYDAVDRFLVKVLWWHFGFAALMAFSNSYLRLAQHYPSPFSWRVLSASEALGATLVGFLAAAVPTVVRGELRNHYIWRIIVSVAFTVYSYLFVFMSGGSIEMHFHFFMVMALLTVYADWRLGWIVLVLTAAHHGILNYVAPNWVYFYGRNDLAVVAHALPVAATAIFTSLLCVNHRRSVAALDATRQKLELGIQERQAAMVEAERANREKNEFLSRMSHELRTPLNAILGFGQLLEMDHLSLDHEESVRYILKAGRHLLTLVDEILDISRIETGRLAISPEPVRVSDVLQEAMDLVAPTAATRRVRFNGDPAEVSQRYVLADRQRLTQVFLNLLSNAVKYNRDGGLVTLSWAPAANGGLRVSVTDTGPGIPSDKMERLFVPFDRLGAEATGVEGAGLGLSLSKRLVEAMGGTLGAESVPGRGSTFWVELPVVDPPADAADEIAHVSYPAAPGAARARRVVLYIEDNLSNLTLVQRLLAHRPEVSVLPAMQGRLGLELAREHRPHLILLDLNLPDISGADVLRDLREKPETRDIPVVVISADITPGQIARLRDAGARQYLTKPLDVKMFLAVLDDVLTDRDADHAGRDA
jgi:signal transduction histidine kinase/CheY-like chemotaxis protein